MAAKGLLGRACSVYEAVSAAFEAGAAIARPHELVRTESGYATVLDFVDGPSLGELVTEGHVTPQEAGRMMAQCLRELHALHGDKDRMRDIREPFLRIVDNLAPWLTKRTSKICRDTISNIPATATLVHGDFYMGNIIVGKNGRLTLIDADTISMGQPVFDLAYTYNTLVCESIIDPKRAEAFHGMQSETTKAIWQSLISCYYAETGKMRSDETDRQIELIAWIVLLNRLKTARTNGASFGESALQILHAAARLSNTAQRMQNTCEDLY